MRPSLTKTILLLILLPFTILAVKYVLDTRRGAAGIPADIVVDSTGIQGNFPSTFWQNLSQGGEEPLDMIQPAIPLLRAISPKLIRIDHLFDYYKVETSPGIYDFSRLDQAVNSILLTGARPMLSISYTPDSKAPTDWNKWYQLVKATAHRYSIEKNISGIYYEVWNEPDLFGGWHYAHDPNYSTLYTYTSQAIVDGATGASFKVGGPATTAYYANWIKALFKTASTNKLRLDFISWHKYTKNIVDYSRDFENLNQILSDYPQFFNIERIITEIGPSPEPDSWYDNKISGIHLMALSTNLIGKIHRAFTFEPIDGPSPRSSLSTGWGIISHNLSPKPRYYAIQFLNKMLGQQLSTSGNGSWVTSLASKNGKVTQILLVNYDQNNVHAETFPLTIQNLIPGNYQLNTINYLGQSSSKKITSTTNYRENIYLEPNSAIILELQKL